MENDFNIKNGSDEGETPEVLQDRTYNVGEFSVLVPAGWCEVPMVAMNASEGFKTDGVCICKGGINLFTNPYAQVNYFGPSVTMLPVYKGIYKDIKDIEEFTAGAFTWSGFYATSFNKSFILLQTRAGEHEFQINVWNEQENGSLTLEDADLMALLRSLTPGTN